MSFGISDAKLALNDMPDSGRSPQTSVIPELFRPSFQNRLDSLLLFFAESWFSTGTTSFPKPNPTIFLKLFSPTIDRLPMCPYSTRNIGFAIAFF